MKLSANRSTLESGTLSEKASIMSTVPESDEVHEISRRIDQILEILRIQNSLLCHLIPQSAKLSSDMKELTSMDSKLDAIDNSLSIIKEFFRSK
jgi:hypothetical protein